MLPSWSFVPENLTALFEICRFLYIRTPEYARASQRVVSYFLTDLDFIGARSKAGDKTEQDELREWMRDGIAFWIHLAELGMDWSCFGGETKVTTRTGVFAIKDLAGKTVDVLSKGGVFRPATFKAYGKQPLLEVEFSDGQKIYATPEHQWEITNNSSKERRVTTTSLVRGHRIVRTVAAQRPEKNAEYEEGIRHGFIFGDGNLYNRRKKTVFSCANFHGAKIEMLRHFEGHHSEPVLFRADRDMCRIHGFPARYKNLPEADLSASYWYGFVCGFIASDGCVESRDGCVSISQVSKQALAAVAEQLPRLGMAAGRIKHQKQMVDMRGLGRGYGFRECEMHHLALLRNFMQPDDLLRAHHRANFLAKNKQDSKYGQKIQVTAVRKTSRMEEVYCCEEMETHTLVVGNGILSGNCFGNAFGRMHRPFNRFLLLPTDNGHSELSVSEFPDAKYQFESLKYEIQDPTRQHRSQRHRRTIKVNFIDRVARDMNRLSLRRIDPSYAYLQHSDRSGRYQIAERFQPYFKAAIRRGDLWQVNETPIAQLRALSTDSDFLYNEGEVFHLRAPCISGISDSGWGMPEIMANFPNIHQMAVYRRIDEAIGLDYMLPFRVFFPQAGSSGTLDAYANQGSMQVWQQMLQQMIGDRRKDPFSIHAMPFQMGFAEVGASGKQLTPKDNMEWQTNAMLNAQGFPAELYSGSMAWQQVPTALRLFENNWQHLPWSFNRHLKWVVKTALDFMGREQMQVKAASPRILDDIESRQVYLQLAAGGEFPRRVAFRPYGVDDPVEAAAERAREDVEIKKQVDKIQADAALEEGAGSLSGGGGGAGGAPGGVSYTPSQKAEQALAESQRLLQIPDDGDRAKQLASIKATDPDMHALVRQKMTELRAAARSQGGAQVAQLASSGA